MVDREITSDYSVSPKKFLGVSYLFKYSIESLGTNLQATQDADLLQRLRTPSVSTCTLVGGIPPKGAVFLEGFVQRGNSSLIGTISEILIIPKS